ncbi:hypothetical protein BBJ28_00007591 [Nothophytophthora sp. Chile5]|nr:hypothetical protein BBJ28_00007591 [Nothophytophthora sp. Chile5]
MDAPIDENTKRTVQKIPLLATRAGPRDGEDWTKRLKEEYLALIQADNDWFTIASNKAGTRRLFDRLLRLQIPATYPVANPELCIPELEGKTSKMYRGGKICLTIHFAPLWQKNVPRFGVAHALALGVRPQLFPIRVGRLPLALLA